MKANCKLKLLCCGYIEVYYLNNEHHTLLMVRIARLKLGKALNGRFLVTHYDGAIMLRGQTIITSKPLAKTNVSVFE